MSPPVPKTAMVFAAGLGMRMRPITETLPKPLIKVGGRALIDHCLDRLAENGVERAIVNVHWLADQIEAHLAGRRSPKILISDERATLLDQGGGIKRALPLLGDEPFFLCNTDAFWIEGPRSNSPASPRRSIPRRWTSCSWSRPAPARSASTGRAISPWTTTAGSSRASRAMSRPSSTPASASSSRSCSRTSRRRSSASRRSFTRRRPRAGSSASGSTAFGCMSGGRRAIAEAETRDRRSTL